MSLPPLVVRLPPFDVQTERGDVAAFRAALGQEPGEGVPLTFPIRWLASPEVQDRLRGVAGDQHVLLVHESQSFAYERLPEAGRTYRLFVTLRRESGRAERAVVHGRIVDPQGAAVGEVETVLRLVEPPGSSP